jgi:hypothetical protein
MEPNSAKGDDVMSHFRVIKWRRIRQTEHVPQMEVVQNVYKILDGKYGVNKPHARHMHK